MKTKIIQNYLDKVLKELRCYVFAFLAAIPLQSKKIDSNKVVMMCNHGTMYGCNPKYIAEALLMEASGTDIVWMIDGRTATYYLPEGIRAVRLGSVEGFREMATARIWVDNCRSRRYIRKKPGQFYIQTWHASIWPKRTEKDAQSSLSHVYIQGAKRDGSETDLMFSNNDFAEELYRNHFWYDGPILRCGVPRNEPLIGKNYEKIRLETRQELGIDKELLCLYAPTFRNDREINRYRLDWNLVKNHLEKRFGKRVVIAVRLHPNIAKAGLSWGEGIKDLSMYPDAQRLLAASDTLISDYSSIAEDFSFMGKPGYIFAPDLGEYDKERGFNYPLEIRPFPMASDFEGLLSLIDDTDDEDFAFRRDRFEQYIGFDDTGCGARQLAKIISFILKKSVNESIFLSDIQSIIKESEG